MAKGLKKLPTLLLITDNPLHRGFFDRVIDKIDHLALICVSSKLEALEFLEKTYISFIVIDEKTPHLDLIPLCNEIHILQGNKHTPIVVITGHLKKSLMRQRIKAGATDFLREPLDEDEFLLRMEFAESAMATQSKMAALTNRVPSMQASDASLQKRTILDDRATRLVGQALEEKTDLSIILLYIDQYPQIISARGENVAHALTLDVEDRLGKMMRTQDVLYNQGEGNFTILLPKTSSKAAIYIAENLHECTIRFTLTLSIGIASLEYTGDVTKSAAVNLERILNGANHCLNRAKEEKNTIISKEGKTP